MSATLTDEPSWLAHYRACGAALPANLNLASTFVDALNHTDPLPPRLKSAAASADVLGEIQADADSISAVLLGALPQWGREQIETEFGANVVSLMDGLKRIRAIETLSDDATSIGAQQLESLRKMLLAMAQDMRVVLIMLAEQVGLMRSLTRATTQAQRQVARQTLNLYAPLANRLGVWQLKWELEDLAFRFLEPTTYQNVARLLDEQRGDRENYIEKVATLLQQAIDAEGLKVAVQGRPKHLYSIYKKMQDKHLAFDDLHDVRALRVLADDVRDCYTALGVVHNLWQPIPGGFDDYIAQPKGNNYRSLHTAVMGPEGRTLEVQIRTHDMHRESEFGVAAHWRYKDGGKADRKYDAKIAWLRQVLDWRDEVSAKRSGELLQDSVYVLTPQGQVIDLPRGATPVDFAYHLHTDLGHRCRGAKVDGAIVPLSYVLQNAQHVEIIAAKQGGPSRDWLNTNLGYLASHRGMAKVRQWFNHQELALATASGRALLEKEMQRAGKTGVALEQVADSLKFSGVNALFAAIGHGEVTPRQIQQALVTEVVEVPEAGITQTAKALTTSRGIRDSGIKLLPQSLHEAVEELRNDAVVKSALGVIADEFIDLKSREWQSYHKQVSAWEVDQYLTSL